MTDRSYTTSFTVDQTPAQAFVAISNVRDWWSQNIEGVTNRVGEKFKYRYEDLHRCEIQVRELIPNRRVVWHVLDNYFSFTQDRSGWKGTDILFEIARKGEQTEVTFTHLGLVPEYECYDACSEGWHTYVTGSLRDLIVTGRGCPNIGAAITESARLLMRSDAV